MDNALPHMLTYDALEKAIKSIVNQMTTDPINRIKEMAGTKQGDEALRMFTQIFALEDAVETAAEKVNQSDATALGKPAVHLNENRQEPVPAYVPAGV